MLELGNLPEKGLVSKCICLSVYIYIYIYIYIYTSGLTSQNIAVYYDCRNFVAMSHFSVNLEHLSY
jgi:hypothetical protein